MGLSVPENIPEHTIFEDVDWENMIDDQRDGFDPNIELERQREMDREILNPMKEEIDPELSGPLSRGLREAEAAAKAEAERVKRLQKLSESKPEPEPESKPTFSRIFKFPGNSVLDY